ncbi:MAG: hypothetical protein QOH72_151 [Solirubrobacteraceae bacterium]|jgi:hypothetical protein|nr:hypothetical protein [Solirubrobacteraceae bacterium]
MAVNAAPPAPSDPVTALSPVAASVPPAPALSTDSAPVRFRRLVVFTGRLA